ncbi:DUF1836 domain-containing protein [Weissella viridescens]|uniref:DUF1836 domain-containing protein n=1 Tax=Weissella viridescens TaxID=1629 RepID=UPI0017460272|nr:DUF1836 domain-containing protein [Weissella viridescens]QOD86410.1 DUF1836 domain-containing protein [Weissella viridescens]
MTNTKLNKWDDFKLPRWDTLPGIDLYLDQVIELINGYLAPVTPADEKKILTASMLNNYVKQDLMPAPVKKKYSRQHLVFLIVITLMKQTFTLSEIKSVLTEALAHQSIKAFYDAFCDKQEKALHFVENFQTTESEMAAAQPDAQLEELVTMAISTSLYSKQLIADLIGTEE